MLYLIKATELRYYCLYVFLRKSNHSENDFWFRPTVQNCKLNNGFILISTASEMYIILANNRILLSFKSLYLIMA